MNFLAQVAIDSLPKNLLLLVPELDSTIVYSSAAKIVHVGHTALVRHAVPFEKPAVGKPLPFDVQLIL